MDFGQKQENDSMILEVRIVFSLGRDMMIIIRGSSRMLVISYFYFLMGCNYIFVHFMKIHRALELCSSVCSL